MLLIDVVTYASVMTKMCSASSRDPPGALGGPKRARGGHTKSRSNEKMLLINFVAYASVMTKMHFGLPLIPKGGTQGGQGCPGDYTNLINIYALISVCL